MIFKFEKEKELQPHKIVCEATLHVSYDLKLALDVGVGNGRNSIYLSQQGFCVDAIDKSIETIKALEDLTSSKVLTINPIVLDISTATIAFSRYGLILFIQVLHYLPKLLALSILNEAIKHARTSTIHVIGAITDKGDFNQLKNAEKFFYPSSNELIGLYQTNKWKILNHFTIPCYTKQTKENGKSMVNEILFLIAQSPE